MTQTVRRGQRYSKDFPCPICGGYSTMPRGKGVRCTGFVGHDGKFAHCSREELAGGLPAEELDTYAHRLEGACKCGETHGEAPAEERRVPISTRPANGAAARPAEERRTPRPANGAGNGAHGPELAAAPPPARRSSGEHDRREGGRWDYESGLRVVRLDFRDDEGHPDKRYVQWHRHVDGSFAPGLSPGEKCPAGCSGTTRTLYLAPELRRAAAAAFVWFVEGEKCVDRLSLEGMVATTTPGGAKSFTAEVAARAVELLAGRHVVILPDADPDGLAFAEKVREALAPVCASLRVLELPGLAAGEDVYDWLERGGDAEDLVRLAERAPDRSKRPRNVGEILCSDLFAAPQRTFATSFARLDDLLDGGIKARQVTAIAAPTGAGKTAFACELARALRVFAPILYVSTELEAEEIAARIAGPLIHARASDILALRADPRRAAAAVEGWPIYPMEIDDDGEVDPISQITAKLLAIKVAIGTTPIVIADYLQELAPDDQDKRRGAVARVAKRLRVLARRHDTAVIAVSSVGRSFYSQIGRKTLADEEDPRAWLSAAKEAGEIEYAAAVFVYLDTATEVGPTGESHARLIVAKSRRGRVGFVGLRFHGPTGIFLPNDSAVSEMGPERRELERERKVLDAVGAAKGPQTKDEVCEAVGGDRTANWKTIKRLVGAGRLTVIKLKRPDALNRMRDVEAVVLPDQQPGLEVN